jgi:hypothetical protein
LFGDAILKPQLEFFSAEKRCVFDVAELPELVNGLRLPLLKMGSTEDLETGFKTFRRGTAASEFSEKGAWKILRSARRKESHQIGAMYRS